MQSQNLFQILYETFIQKIVKAAADIPKERKLFLKKQALKYGLLDFANIYKVCCFATFCFPF